MKHSFQQHSVELLQKGLETLVASKDEMTTNKTKLPRSLMCLRKARSCQLVHLNPVLSFPKPNTTVPKFGGRWGFRVQGNQSIGTWRTRGFDIFARAKWYLLSFIIYIHGGDFLTLFFYQLVFYFFKMVCSSLFFFCLKW